MEHNIENKKSISLIDLLHKNRVNRQVSPTDAKIIISLLQGIDLFVNKKLNIYTEEQLENAKSKQEIANLLFELRSHWYKDTSIIDEFIKEADIKETPIINLLQSWKRFIQDEFIFIRFFPECAVLQSVKTHQYYAVLGLNSDFDEIFPTNDVKVIKTTLLPFLDKIIWDGLIVTSDAIFNPSFSKQLVESCKLARRKNLLITSI